MSERKTIGIIGGMGPLASCDLYKKIILNTKAKCDNDHIRIYIDSNTKVPDRTNAILHGGESPLNMLIESARKLQSIGADIIIIACNTSHYYIESLRNSVNVRILSIIEETLDEIKKRDIKKVALLATTGTVKSRIYQNLFERSGIDILVPDDFEQELVMDIIYKGVKTNNTLFCSDDFQNMIRKKEEMGVEAIVLGCTELPIATDMYNIKGNFIDSNLILARSAIKAAGAEIETGLL